MGIDCAGIVDSIPSISVKKNCMTTYIKFGGSVITDKRTPEAPDVATIQMLAQAIATARSVAPLTRLLLSHGSGSYGHVAAARYGIHKGLAPDADWYGYAVTSGAASRLNRIVVDALLAVDVPALTLQPSATCETDKGAVVAWDTRHIQRALTQRMIPVIHGDVAFDRSQGCSIASTDLLLQWLTKVPELTPTRIILVGESAVYTADPHSAPDAQRIPLITTSNITQVLDGATGSHGVDVTGGMASKIRLMWSLITHHPQLDVVFIRPDSALLIRAILRQDLSEGTVMQF
jgi:isopentenyl phosphate kinase